MIYQSNNRSHSEAEPQPEPQSENMKQYQSKDKYFDEAKKKGYRARSVFKLEEIQERFKLMKKGDKVLDLGAAPGSFLKFISELVGDDGYVVGVDLQEISPFDEPNIHTIVADVMDEANFDAKMSEMGAEVFDAIISDMAPKTIGIKFVDGGKSMELNQRVLRIADKYLKVGGNVLMKLLPGSNEGELIGPLKKIFKKVRHVRPKAVRKSSGEFYLVGLGRKL